MSALIVSLLALSFLASFLPVGRGVLVERLLALVAHFVACLAWALAIVTLMASVTIHVVAFVAIVFKNKLRVHPLCRLFLLPLN